MINIRKDQGNLGQYEEIKSTNTDNKGRENQDKCMENIFNRIIKYTFSNLKEIPA
jgi:hypothetical protein